MSKHTPGVWVADKTVDGKHHIVTLPDGRIAAYCGYIGAHDDAESQANARLIAAAPELLEALKECLQSLDYLDRSHYEQISGHAKRYEDMKRAREAIAKAAGEHQ